jgi:hypothetical protein
VDEDEDCIAPDDAGVLAPPEPNFWPPEDEAVIAADEAGDEDFMPPDDAGALAPPELNLWPPEEDEEESFPPAADA